MQRKSVYAVGNVTKDDVNLGFLIICAILATLAVISVVIGVVIAMGGHPIYGVITVIVSPIIYLLGYVFVKIFFGFFYDVKTLRCLAEDKAKNEATAKTQAKQVK